MKKLSLLLVAILLAVTGVLAQTPNQFKYQAVLRDAGGQIMSEEAVTVDISILQGSASGTSVFDETHSVTTTAQGLINLDIGSISNLDVVDWGSNSYFMKITVAGTEMGISQLLKVPYAIHSETAETALNVSNYTETQSLSDVILISNNAQNNSIVNVLQFGIGTIDVEECAALEVSSTTQGFLPPRMSEFEIEQIVNSVEGLMVYNTTTHNPVFHNGTNWVTYDGSVVYNEIEKYHLETSIEEEEYPILQIYNETENNRFLFGGNLNSSQEPLNITRIAYINTTNNILGVMVYNNLNPSSFYEINLNTGSINDTIILFANITATSFTLTCNAFDSETGFWNLYQAYDIDENVENYIETECTYPVDLNYNNQIIPTISSTYQELYDQYSDNIVMNYFLWKQNQPEIKSVTIMNILYVMAAFMAINYACDQGIDRINNCTIDDETGKKVCGTQKNCNIDDLMTVDPVPQYIYQDSIP